MKNPSELLYQRIQRKENKQALLYASYTLLIGILSVGFYIFKEYEQYKKEGERTTKSIIEIQARQLSDFYTDQLQDVESISSHWLILRYLDLQFNSGFVGTNSKNLVQDYLFRRKQEHGFSDIVLYDTDGSTLLSTNPALVYTDVDIPAALDKSLRDQHPYVSDVYRSNQNARLYLDFIVPIVDSQDKLRAGLMYKVDVEKNISSLFGNWQITTYKPVIQLIRSDALGQPASVNLTLNSDSLNLWMPVQSLELNRAIQQKRYVSGQYTNTKGCECNFILMPVQDTPWTLLYEFNRKEALGQFMTTVFLLVSLLLISTVLFYFVIRTLFKRQRANYFQRWLESDEALKETKTYYQFISDTLDEAILVVDRQGMIRTMNLRAESLLNQRLVDIKGQSLDLYFRLHQNLQSSRIPITQSVLLNQMGMMASLTDVSLEVIKGEYIPVTCKVSPLPVSSSMGSGFMISLQDHSAVQRLKMDLHKSNIRFRDLFQDAPDGFILVDHSGTIRLANVQAHLMFSYKTGEMDGLNIEALVPHRYGHHAQYRAGYAQNPKARSMGEKLKLKALRKDGSEFSVIVALSPVTYDDESMVMAIVRDITVMEEQERQLRFSDAVLRNMQEGVVLVDPVRFTIEFANPRLVQMLSVPEEELIGMPVRDSFRFDPIDGHDPLDYIAENLRSGESLQMIIGVTRPDGLHMWVNVHVYGFQSDVFGDTWMAVVQDVSEKKHIEQEAMQQQARFRTLKSEMPDVVWTASADGSTIYEVNDAFETIYGVPKQTLYDHPLLWDSFVHPEDRPKAKQSAEELIEKGRSEMVYRIIRPDGQIRWLMDRKRLVYDEHGAVTQFGGIASDITEDRMREEALLEARNRAEESDRLKSAFLSNISHELRTPLNSIIGFAHVLGEALQNNAELYEHTEFIAQNGERLLHLLNQIVAYSTMASGNKSVQNEAFILYEAVDRVYKKSLTEANNKGLELKCLATSEDQRIRVTNDVALFEEALMQLLNNAIRFTQEGGVELGVYAEGAQVVCYVRDSGIGIAEAHWPRLFDPFYQSNNSFDRGYEGAGLGLALCKAYCDLMGVDLRFETEVGVGTTFYLRVPM